MQKTLVLFDWDGTLVDTHAGAPAIHVEVFRQMGLPVTLNDMIRLFGQSSTNLTHSVRAMHNLPKLSDTDPTLIQQTQQFEELEESLLKDLYLTGGARLFYGAVDLLNNLSAKGYILGLASNGMSTTVQNWVNLFGLTKLFDNRIYGPDKVAFKGKPAPDMLSLAMHENGVDAKQTVLVGDTINDMGAAAAAGCAGILIAHDGVHISDQAKKLATHQIANFAEIEPIITKIAFQHLAA